MLCSACCATITITSTPPVRRPDAMHHCSFAAPPRTPSFFTRLLRFDWATAAHSSLLLGSPPRNTVDIMSRA
ncbi:hypothetical protein BVRB_8g183300 [Beta vulgaris subsp. vulgaris]|nr:hypothetical protein BVRB_8g183300 [Beta vulgaris subsp. vulgaris]